MKKVAIVLSAYNGGRFLSAQLDSLLNQTYPGITIFIRDDGSADESKHVIEAYRDTSPGKIKLIEDELGNIGVWRSFRKLLKKCDADYYLFCDQDDIWDKNKVDILVHELNALEGDDSANLPCLVCSDYRIVSEDNELIVRSSFEEYGPTGKELLAGLFQGFLPGCTMIFNGPAKDLFLRYEGEGLHDKQLLILTFIFGQIGLCGVQCMSYRVHANNTVGLRRNTSRIVLVKDLVKFLFDNEKYRRIILRDYFEMYGQLSRQIPVSLLKDKGLLSASEIDEMGWCQRKRWFLNHFKPFHMSRFEGVIQLLLF